MKTHQMTVSHRGDLVEQLLAEGLVTAEQLEAVVHHLAQHGGRLEDVVIERGFVAEQDLLKFLAKVHRTRFVVTQKLARVDIDRALLELVPRKVAEELQVFPILYEASGGVLSVVAANPDDHELVPALRRYTGVEDVKVYVARPAGVRAAILKHYNGELYAFAQLDQSGKQQYMTLLDLYERNASAFGSQVGPMPEPPRERTLTEKELTRVPAGRGGSAVSRASFAEVSTVLVSLLENGRGELRGHSVHVARMVRKLGERIRLAPEEIHAAYIAALFHDVGKSSTYHLTPLNVAVFESHRTVAQKSHATPARLFEAVPLDPSAAAAIQSMYERFDGQGFPDGLAGKEIPLGARLLSMVDTYCDLTQNPRNPYRRALTPAEACEVLDRHRNVIFDRNLIDLLRQTVTGDDLRARLLSERSGVLVIDPDPEESTVLELRLLEEGFDVHAARSAEEALGMFSRLSFETVIAETDLGDAEGVEFLKRVRAGGQSWSGVTWIFVTRDARRDTVARGYEAGASDFVIKPAPPEVLVAKVRQMLAQKTSRSPRGVAGSLSEMGLPDVIQVLCQGRKSGKLGLRRGAEGGEVHFHEGVVVNALWGALRGEDAFYAMLSLSDGEFTFDPTFKATARVIATPVEALLLEGMRRLDEARA